MERAYLDESARLTGPGLYVVAAVVVPDTAADDVRAALRALLPPRQVRFHWTKEQAAMRHRAAGTLASLAVPVVAVTMSPVEAHKTERARRHCLLRLLWELECRGVRDIVIESRQRPDANDRQVIAAGQRAGRVSGALRYQFGLPKDECLLWLPDIAAGAVARAVADADATYVEPFAASLSVVELP